MITLLSYFKNYKLRLFITIIIKIIGTLCELVIPYILSYVLDEVIPNIEGHNIKPIINYGVIMCIFALLFLILNILANRMASKTSSLIVNDERNKLYESIMKLKLSDIDSITIPSLVSRTSSDTYNLYQALNTIQRLGIRSPFLFFGGLLVCSLMSVTLTLIFYVIAPILTIIIVFISKIGIKLFTKIQSGNDTLGIVVREYIVGARVIKAFSKEEYERNKYNKLNGDVFKIEIKAGYTMAMLNPLVNFVINIALTVSVLYGAFLVKNLEIKVGSIIAFMSYFTIISNAMVSLSRIFEQTSRGYASALRIKYVLKIDSSKNIINLNKSNNYIEFDNVSFSYNKNNEYAISNISFRLNKGESLGIFGSTGSGKSTILNLLMGFYEDYEGNIYLNHNNLRSLDLKEITKLFSSVLQTDILFNESIKDNILFDKEMNEEELIQVLKDAEAYYFVYDFKDNINHVIGPKGNDLSGGQKQRLCIARALANMAPILILDDSSSALDYKTDSKIRSNLNNYNLTQIIVAQRVSSIINCDKILVIDDGKIIGYGNHSELLNTCKEYRYIYDIQMGDDING